MVEVQQHVPLAPRCTLELGGPAEFLVEAASPAEVADALQWAEDRALPIHILGGGSNLVVADSGVPGLVLQLVNRGISVQRERNQVLVTAQAGEPWDELVAWTVAQGWAGLECLSGIPGNTGATPIQNVGAYGREVKDVLREVLVLDRRTRQTRLLEAAECVFGYRDSRFRRCPEEFVVLAVTFALKTSPDFLPEHEEIFRELGSPAAPPPAAAMRETVLAVRRRKSTVLDPTDLNRRSAGSFFLNPVVEEAEGRAVALRAVSAALVGSTDEVRLFPAGPGRVKLSAAWLVEHAGFPPGTRRGAVGTSSKHSLILVHHGGGTTAELVSLASEIRAAVASRFGITLHPEPSFWGFGTSDPLGA